MLERHEKRFLDRVFTATEQKIAGTGKRQIEKLSGRFACKEAVLKLIGTGWRGKIAWTDIEVINDPLGKPIVNLTGEVKRLADKMNLSKISISITHTANFVIASAVAISED